MVGISQDSKWYAVIVPTDVAPDGIGWVNANYVVLSNPSGVDIPVITNPEDLPDVSPPPPAEGSATVTTTDVISVRNGPSNQCESYGKATTDVTSTAIGIRADGGWYAVIIPTEYAPDGIGWMNANYLVTSNTENLPVMESQYCP